ncbi:unnamed protein product [Mucor hiemalis]
MKLVGKDENCFGYAFRFHYKLVRALLGLTTMVEGRENLLDPSQPAVYMCNHQTMMDIHLVGNSVPDRASIVMKKAIKYYPFFGQFLTMYKSIYLDRSNRNDAIAQARQAAKQIHKENLSVFGFPEGTRNGGQGVDLLPFKKGLFHIAIQAKVPIVPIVIGNYQHIYDAKKKHLGHGAVNVKVLPAIPTKDIPEDSESVARLIEDVRGQMLTALKEISAPVKKIDRAQRAKI